MSRYARIDEIKKGVVFSDPWYDENTWCQYRKGFTDRNWFMKLETSAGEYDTLCFQLVMGRSTLVNSLDVKETEDGYRMKFPEHYSMAEVELGIDTACIYMGSMKNFEEFGESIAFKTGGDGGFGDLFVYSVKGEDAPAGFALFGAFDKDFMTEEHLFGQLKSTFDGKEISKEEFDFGISDKLLANRMLLANELRIAQSFTKEPEHIGLEQNKETDSPNR